MKRIFKYIFAITAGLGIAINAFAGDDDIVLGKQISAPDANGLYTITLDAFVTGQSQTTHSESVVPCDIILVLDLSSSMTKDENNVTITSKGNKISTNTGLGYDKNYIVTIDGKDYFLRGFRSGTSGNRKYNYRIQEGSAPASVTDGIQFGDANMSSEYKVKNTDNIYSISTSSVTRLEALKQASQQFVQTVYDNSPEGGSHKISFIGFNRYGGMIAGCTDANPFKDVTAENVASLKTSVGNIKTSDLGTNNNREKYTNPAEGLYKAAQVLETVKNDGRSKVVVLFTDGEPCEYGTDNFNNTYGRTAVNMSYVIKQPTDKTFTEWQYADPQGGTKGNKYSTGYGAKVYSVAILSSEGNQTRRFLHYVSSNYPDQNLSNSYTFPNNKTGDGGEAPHDYYQLSNGSNLSSIFQKIADDSSQGTASVSLGATNSRIVDIMSDNFQIPTNASDISIHVEEFFGSSMEEAKITDRTNANYSDYWKIDSDYAPTPSYELYSSKDDGVNDAIRITGFDFSKDDGKKSDGVTTDYNTDGSLKTPGNWVGPRTNTNNVTVWYGRKIVIQFKVKINPDYSPGYGVPSNDINSGIEKLENGNWTAVEKFPVPTVDRPGLCIMKDGLEIGESSIFSVSAGSNTYNVVLSQKGTKNGIKLPCYIILKGLPAGTYSVTETNWSWTYSTTPTEKVITQTIKGLTEEEVSTIKNAIVSGSSTVSNNGTNVGKSIGNGTTSSAKYAILNDEYGLVTTYGTVVLLYQFSNEKKGSNPANAEARINNKFTGGTNTSDPAVEDGADDGEIDL